MNFASVTVEREYLAAAPAHEVLRYLDQIAQRAPISMFFSDQYIPEDIELALLKRDERLIDLGLARICSKVAFLIAERRGRAATQAMVPTQQSWKLRLPTQAAYPV